MDLGKYEVETYIVLVNGQSENRQRIIFNGNNDENFFIERYYGSIRSGYKGANTFFKNLSWTNIKSHIVGESIVINDNSSPQKPQIYFNISNLAMESSKRKGVLITKLLSLSNSGIMSLINSSVINFGSLIICSFINE